MMSQRQKQYALSILFALLSPLWVLLHEAGHYLAAFYYRFDPLLSFASVHYKFPSDTPANRLMVITAAGPTVNVLAMILAIIGLHFAGRAGSGSTTVKAWLWTFVASGGFRFFQGVYYLLEAGWLALSDNQATSQRLMKNDEAKISLSLDLPVLTFTWLTVIFAVIGFTFVYRFHKRNGSLGPFFASAPAAALSMALYVAWLGPIMLPKPKPTPTKLANKITAANQLGPGSFHSISERFSGPSR